jgi:tetratricopeptide (TPR) repeat protein
MRAGDPARAHSLLAELLRRETGNVDAWVAMGVVSVTRRPAEAIGCFSKALELKPDCLPACIWLATLAMQRGDFDRAAGFAERAVKIDPSNAQALNILVRCHLQRDRFALAVDWANRGLEALPNDAGLLYAKASALRSMNYVVEAAAAFRRAASIEPEPEGLTMLSDLELELGRVSEAISVAERAVKLKPEFVDAHLALARALTQIGDLKAEQAWESAKRHGALDDTIHTQKARSQLAAGRFDDAAEEFRAAISANPRQGYPYYWLASSKRLAENDRELIDQMERALTDPGLTAQDRRHLEYALGKAANDLNDFESAMRHWDEANRLNRELFMKDRPFDREDFQRQVDRQIELLDQPQPGEGLDSELPILVVGMMRSGTTLAEQILTCHPQIGGAGELGFWAEQAGAGVVKESGAGYIQLLESISPGMTRVVDKNPANLMLLGLIHQALPRAQIIYMRRHPVDTALSIWLTAMGTAAPFVGDKSDIVFAYRECERLMDEVRDRIRLLAVQYEDLTAEPELWIRRMVEFCSVPWDPACLHPETNPRAVKTPSLWQVRQPINRGATGRWKNYEPWLGAFSELIPDGNSSANSPSHGS